MKKLSKYEKETIINWNEAENLASVYTFNASLKRRLAEFSRKYPQKNQKGDAPEKAKKSGSSVGRVLLLTLLPLLLIAAVVVVLLLVRKKKARQD